MFANNSLALELDQDIEDFFKKTVLFSFLSEIDTLMLKEFFCIEALMQELIGIEENKGDLSELNNVKTKYRKVGIRLSERLEGFLNITESQVRENLKNIHNVKEIPENIESKIKPLFNAIQAFPVYLKFFSPEHDQILCVLNNYYKLLNLQKHEIKEYAEQMLKKDIFVIFEDHTTNLFTIECKIIERL
jgi:hypothetical protein